MLQYIKLVTMYHDKNNPYLRPFLRGKESIRIINLCYLTKFFTFFFTI